ncbi:phosphoglycerate mutase, BPG-dependent, family 1 [secondary endosymbiont of Heteropsylla cubana]|uniref:2,3-bisphosphoglycerate-dependent phosphoglycerate mutase n=1 Tax=secondary endosymbiont of Heteropsylla cubana TaxID=134287 RepID=J3VU46_9ENTR|nr:2,3-diphosphoglycerate-dependent phosphoglycerate mutase [secondary endosymbiont of Heteropsylla cubana]AFP85621.1 phosphoglycerate mutase, BPG-dependent, family 1 [secondary endosymbiont of Heteropsylla cubana]
MNVTKVVLIRHGESQWNRENRFTGWTDIDLSIQGRREAKKAGQILKQEGYFFDFSYTSVLKRAIHTLWVILDELDQTWLPVEKSWYLNERHYGALQGLNKTETVQQYGNEQVKQWRRSFGITPPALSREDGRFSGNDPRYANISPADLPTTESLALTINRVFHYWNKVIFPRIKLGNRIIIAAHGNTIRAIRQFLDNLSEGELLELNVPTGIPLIYEFSENMKPIEHYYLSKINIK